MKLIAIPGTILKPQSINLLTENDNLFANVNKWGELTLYGEDMRLINDEVEKVLVITHNFNLFFSNLTRLQSEIEELNKEILFTLIPTLGLQ